MARTYNDIYYNDDENSTAEILDDMKKLAESVDQQIGSIKSFNNDTSQFIEQVTPLMSNLSEQVIDMHQLADTMFTELEQVKEENKQLRQDLNGLPKGQASGESIDLNDSAEMRCELKISGNSKQETRAGYNLLNFDVKQNSRVTYNNEDGTITINGQGGFTLAFKQFTAKANTKYYIKWELVSGTVDTSKSNGNSFLDSLDNKNIKQGEFKESVVESDKDITGFWVNNMIVFTNAVIKFWANTNKSDFEQYGASPSPDYPSEVECCGDNINIFDGEVEEGNIDASTGKNAVATNAWRSKNYLNVKDTSVSISIKDLTFSGTVGRLYFYKSDNTYISNILINSLPFTATLPNETAKVRFFILNSVADINAKIKLEKGSTVTPYSPYGQGCINEVISNYKNLFIKGKGIVIGKFLSSDGSIGTDTSLFYQEDYIEVTGGTQMIISAENKENFRIVEYDSNKTFIRRDFNEGGTKTYTITLSSNCRYIRVSTTLANLDSLIIQEGSTIANNQSQTYTIPTQQSFRAIDNIRDTFIKKNNKWFERHNIARLVLKGNGFWSYNAGVGFHSSSLQGIVKNGSEALSNKYKYTPLTWQGNYTFSINSTGLIAISDNTYSTVDDWKAHLAEQYANGTPVYVDYLLAEPLDIECTEEQSTILDQIENEAKTYKNVTHIYSTDEISPVIDVTYKKDIETLFANTLVEGV